jgi:hypothetical protein
MTIDRSGLDQLMRFSGSGSRYLRPTLPTPQALKKLTGRPSTLGFMRREQL